MSNSSSKKQSTLVEWAIKQQISYILGAQRASRQRLYRMVLVGSLGIPTYLVGAYKLSQTIGDNELYYSNSILSLLILSPFVVIVMYLMYISEHDAAYRYADYLNQALSSLKQDAQFKFWEEWVRDIKKTSSLKFEVNRSMAVDILVITYFLASTLFAAGAIVKILKNYTDYGNVGYVSILFYILIGFYVLWLCEKPNGRFHSIFAFRDRRSAGFAAEAPPGVQS